MLSALGVNELGSCFGSQEPGRFTGPVYKSSFNPTSLAYEVGLRVYFLNPIRINLHFLDNRTELERERREERRNWLKRIEESDAWD